LKIRLDAEGRDQDRGQGLVQEEVQSRGVEANPGLDLVRRALSLALDLNRAQSPPNATIRIKASLAPEVGVSLQMLSARELVRRVGTDPNRDHVQDLVPDRFLLMEKMIAHLIGLLMENSWRLFYISVNAFLV